MRLGALLGTAALIACHATEPRPYTIAGTWKGSSVGQGTLRLDLTHAKDVVSGTATYHQAGDVDHVMQLQGTLRDSVLSLNASTTSGSPCSACSVAATYRIQESDANAFTVHAALVNFSFDGTVTRQ